MRKSLLTLLIVFCVAINAIAQFFDNGNFQYHIISKNDLTVQVYKYLDSNSNNCDVPSSVIYEDSKYSVVRICNYAFSECDNLTSISLPHSIVEIGERAFFNCNSLENIYVEAENHFLSSVDGILFDREQSKIVAYPPGKSGDYSISNTITSIGNYAFYGCSKLTSIHIPTSITEMGESAFSECSRLLEISIPNSITEIGFSTFSGCSSLTSVDIPNSVTAIRGSAFSNCTALTSIFIPKSVNLIDISAFSSCTALTEFFIEDENPAYSSAEGLLFNADRTTLILCPRGKKGEITVPNSVNEIDYAAFRECSSLTTISLPPSLTEIKDFAFAYCSSLSSISIPNSVMSIGDSAFKGCSSISSITIPNQLTEIQTWTFSDCTALNSVIIPNSVKKISNCAFIKCTALTSLDIPNSVTEIGYQAFWSCTALHSLNVDKGNPNYSSADGVVFNKDQTAIILYPPGKTGTYTIPNSVTEISDCAFEDCNKLTSVIIPNSVRKIGNSAFKSCSAIASISMPDSINELEIYAFSDCTKLISISIPNTITDIKDYVFSGCSSLTSVSLPSSLTRIGSYAFNNCSALTSIVIPENVVVIFSRAFNGCTSLRTIYALPENVPSTGRSAFWDTRRDAVVYVPAGSLDLYKNNGEWRYFSDFREMGALSLIISERTLTMEVGETAILNAIVTKDDDVTIESQVWSSSTPEVATVDESGKVTAITSGVAIITVTILDGYGLAHTESCKVTVQDSSGIDEILDDGYDSTILYYNLNGIQVSSDNLAPGFYIIRKGGNPQKIIIR